MNGTRSAVAAVATTRGGRRAWFALAVLTVAYTFSFLDRMVVNLLVEPMRRDLGLTDTQVSLLMGFSFAIFYTLCGLPLGRLADRGNRRNLIAAGIAVWSLMTAACGIARGYGQLFLARVGVGAGEAALTPAAHSMIADYFPRAQLGRAMSIYGLGIYVGSGLALLLGAVAIRLAALQETWVLPLLGPVFPWQMVFVIVGLPGLLVALLMFAVREPVRSGTVAEVPLVDVWRWLKSERRFLLPHHLGFGLLSLVAYAGAAWAPTAFVRSFGWSVVQAAVLQGVLATVLSVTGCVIGGIIADRCALRDGPNGRLRVGTVAGAGLALSAIGFALVPHAVGAAVALGAFSFFAAMPFGAAAAALAEVAPPGLRGQASALYLFAISVVGIGMGPTAVALCTDLVFGDPAAVRLSIGLVCAIASVGAVLVLRKGATAAERSVVLQSVRA